MSTLVIAPANPSDENAFYKLLPEMKTLYSLVVFKKNVSNYYTKNKIEQWFEYIGKEFNINPASFIHKKSILNEFKTGGGLYSQNSNTIYIYTNQVNPQLLTYLMVKWVLTAKNKNDIGDEFFDAQCYEIAKDLMDRIQED